jgi:Ser/Thr protein kinase RdoA (MazF antagonist)
MSLDRSFYKLTPDVVLEAIESCGYTTTGEYLQLNSYENRVFDVFLETTSLGCEEFDGHLIAKFYRPNRWSFEALHEEHFFEQELAHQGIPVIAPLELENGKTLASFEGLSFSLFKKCFGRMPQELTLDQLKQVGGLLARIHNCGSQNEFNHRPELTPEEFGWPALDRIESVAAPEVWSRYERAAVNILEWLEDRLEPEDFIRIHGDCHKGNLLQLDTVEGNRDFFFVDFDDCVMGPEAQDFWMLFSGDQEMADDEKDSLLSGYDELREIPESQFELFPGLRGLRIIHYAGWIAKRWKDTTFPLLFPQFHDYTYWAEEVEALERIAWSL